MTRIAVDLDVRAHLAQHVHHALVALAVARSPCRARAPRCRACKHGRDDRVQGRRPVQRDPCTRSPSSGCGRGRGSAAKSSLLNSTPQRLSQSSVTPTQGFSPGRRTTRSVGASASAAAISRAETGWESMPSISARPPLSRPRTTTGACPSPLVDTAQAPRRVEGVDQRLAQADVAQRVVAAQHRVAFAAGGQAHEEPQDNPAVAAIDHVVGRLEAPPAPTTSHRLPALGLIWRRTSPGPRCRASSRC